MYDKMIHKRWARLAIAILGALITAASVNLLIVPQNLYTSGILGLCQVIRTLLERAGLTVEFDIAGILYFIANIPLVILAWRSMGRKFVIRMMICIAASSLFLSVIPVPETPIVADELTSCLLGGILSGFGGGLILTCGGSSGGLDTVGLYLSKKGKGTVGRLSIVFNAALYIVCAVLFSLPVALYSAIYSVFSSLFVDRLHQQNIAVQMLIFTKDKGEELREFIMTQLERGVTYWNGSGGYTDQPMQVLCVCLDKYEVVSLRQTIQEVDPTAFIMINEGVHTGGNFERHL